MRNSLVLPKALACLGVVVMLLAGADIALSTGNGGQCFMSITQYDANQVVDPDREPWATNWVFYAAQCSGTCPEPWDCLEYDTGMNVTIQGVTYDLFDCACGTEDEYGVVTIHQFDLWSTNPPLGPSECRTVAMQSQATSTSAYEGGLCLDYNCAGDCEFEQIPGTTYGSVEIGTEWYTTRGAKCVCN